MRAEILCVGSELLLGQITDTNAPYIATQLARAGVNLHRKQTVGDNLERIVDCISGALSRADVLVITGGLGPTTDDLTREAIARALDVELEYHDDLADELKEFFAKRGSQVRETFLRQAYLPAGASALPNSCGTAPGVFFDGEWNGQHKMIFAVPGVPREMKAMLEGGILPVITQKKGGEPEVIVSRVLRTFGIGESSLADPIEDILTGSENPSVAPLIFGNTEVHLRLTAKAASEEAANAMLDEIEDKIRQRVGQYIFGRDDQTLAQIAIDMLTDRNSTLGVAESLTGGMLGSLLTDTSGCSAVYKGAVVAYAPALKEEVLGVSPAEIEMHTVVSEQVAREMAAGAQKLMNATYAISTTGEAGPDSATGAPVGTVYIGLAKPDGETECEKLELHGDRNAIRRRAAHAALDMLRRHLQSIS